MKISNSTLIVLSSTAAVREIMEKNSAIVSDRPASHFAEEITGGNHMGASRYSEFLPFSENDLSLTPPDEHWRRLRRCAREVLTQSACRDHLKIQQAEATQLMYEILTRPEVRLKLLSALPDITSFCCPGFLRLNSSPLDLCDPFCVVWKTRTADHDSRSQGVLRCSAPLGGNHGSYYERPPQVIFEHIRSQQPGAHPPVDLIPVMKYIPERWASWKTEVKITRNLHRKLYFGLLEQVEARIQNGLSNGCFMETVIEKGPGFKLDRDAVGCVFASEYT